MELCHRISEVSDYLSRTYQLELVYFDWVEDELPRFFPKIIFPKNTWEHEGNEFKIFEVKFGWRKFQIAIRFRYYEIP